MPACRFVHAAAIAALTALPVLAGCDTTPASTDPCSGAASGDICTVAGSGQVGFDGEGNQRLDIWMYWPIDLGFDADDTPYILDWNNHMVRRILADGTVETVVGSDEPGDGDPGQKDLTAAGAPGVEVKLNHPSDLLFASQDTPIVKKGQMLLTAWHNHRFRTWEPSTGLVHVTCGKAPGFGGDNLPASLQTRFNQPSKAIQDAAGNTWLVDMRNWRIRRIAADGLVTTIAGSGQGGADAAADQGPVPAAEARFLFINPVEFGNPTTPGGGLAISPDGQNLFVSDTENHRIRVVDLAAGTVRTFAGSGPQGCHDGTGEAVDCAINGTTPPFAGAFAGDGGPATAARLNRPHDIAMGPDGRLYVADTGNHRVRAIDLQTGVITTVAGSGKAPKGVKPFATADLGDGGPATAAALNQPKGIAFDAAGSLWIADTYNHRIRKVIP